MSWAFVAGLVVVLAMLLILSRSMTIWQARAEKAEARVAELDCELILERARYSLAQRFQGASPKIPPAFEFEGIALGSGEELRARIKELADMIQAKEIKELSEAAERAVQDADAKMNGVLEDL